MEEHFIKADNVSKTYGKQQVLNGLSFSIKKGSVIGLIGPNGAGKTTVIRLLNGVIAPDAGSVEVGGLNPVSEGDDIRKISGIVTESAGLYHEMSGLENLRFFAELYDCRDEARIQYLLEAFQLSEHQHKPAGSYSTGMKKRLALAKALLHQPDLLYLDEPTNGLDPEGIQMIIRYLKELNEERGTTIFICSHILHQLEPLCHGYIFLEKGRIVEQGSKDELVRKYLKEIELIAETGFRLESESFLGYPASRAGENRIRFLLPSKDAIPAVLKSLLESSWVHSAQIANDGLEPLYFKIKEGAK